MRWKPGQTGNPKGRPANMGRSVLEHLNDFGTMTEAEIARVAANPKEPASRRIAAKTVLNALQDGDNAMGEPIMGGYLDRIMDRTVGKPKQEMEITHGPAVDEERMKQLEALPLEQLKALRDKLAAAREALTSTVVTTGEVIEAKVLPAPADKGDGPDITGA